MCRVLDYLCIFSIIGAACLIAFFYLEELTVLWNQLLISVRTQFSQV